jgi:hypothetical protein
MKWIVDADTMAELQRRNDELRQARAIAAPDSWPWPMSEDAKTWVESVADSQKPKHERQFDQEEHERFMRSLG